MVSHPETGSDSPIGSDRDQGHDSRDLNPLLDPVGGSKLEPGLLRRFQSKHLFRLIKFFFSKVSRPESPT